MKVFSAEQVKSLDEYTISNEPVKSIDLMERAALACTRALVKLLDTDAKLNIICGQGNNGGDGLAIGRLLYERGFEVKVFVIHHRTEFSADSKINYDQFKSRFPQNIFDINSVDEIKEYLNEPGFIIIDALLGSGINKAAEGIIGEVIAFINKTFKNIISIDVPSGLFTDSTSKHNQNIIRSFLTLTLQFPKLAFFLPENKEYVPEFIVVDIGLHETGIFNQQTRHYYLTKSDISTLLKKRNKFDHKGTFGHALLMAGSKGKSGAAVISAKACLRAGAGMLTVHSTNYVLTSLLHHLPEAMSDEDPHAEFITSVEKTEKYNAVAFGPGVGLNEETKITFKKLLQYYLGRMVIDADGLNMLAENKTWLDFLPPSAILTPHVKEFERLTGKVEDDFERLENLKKFSARYNCIVILKGAYSAIAMPDGNVFFNSTGNPGLAKAGSGDGLTGIILGLLCRGYNPPQAALIGTFIHGYAADLCLKKMSMESILITDVIEQLPKAFKKLEK
jgi:ADP-dependent NAD(P)H-hydrate dehydratase / NAD(P)H-hydrate epimerase